MAEISTTTERAIELARSGECPSVNHIRQLLRREGYSDVGSALGSMQINRELIDLIHKART